MNTPAARQLPQPLTDCPRLARLLGDLACRLDVDAVVACDSTNSRLLEKAGAASGSVLVADTQTGGRGRRGRVWVSAPEDSLTFSVLWRFMRPAAAMSGLSLAVGVALARALARVGIDGVALKWPNDLLRRRDDGVNGWGKAGGILVEMVSEPGTTTAVIGIGINLCPPAQDIAAAIPPIGLAADRAAAPERHALLAAIFAELVPGLDLFAADGFAPFVAPWQALHAFDGEVVLEEGGRIVAAGRCCGVDAQGALLIEAAGRRVAHLSGDLSLRPR